MTKDEFLEKLSQVDFNYEYIENLEKWKYASNLHRDVRIAAQNNPEFDGLFKQKQLESYKNRS